MKNNATLYWILGIAAVGGLGWFLYSRFANKGRPAPANGFGDINQDGYVTDKDIALLEKIMLATYIPTSEEFRRADVNTDGEIDINDYLLIENYIADGTQFPT